MDDSEFTGIGVCGSSGPTVGWVTHEDYMNEPFANGNWATSASFM